MFSIRYQGVILAISIEAVSRGGILEATVEDQLSFSEKALKHYAKSSDMLEQIYPSLRETKHGTQRARGYLFDRPLGKQVIECDGRQLKIRTARLPAVRLKQIALRELDLAFFCDETPYYFPQ